MNYQELEKLVKVSLINLNLNAEMLYYERYLNN